MTGTREIYRYIAVFVGRVYNLYIYIYYMRRVSQIGHLQNDSMLFDCI